jgi:hypothetical protein
MSRLARSQRLSGQHGEQPHLLCAVYIALGDRHQGPQEGLTVLALQRKVPRRALDLVVEDGFEQAGLVREVMQQPGVRQSARPATSRSDVAL